MVEALETRDGQRGPKVKASMSPPSLFVSVFPGCSSLDPPGRQGLFPSSDELQLILTKTPGISTFFGRGGTPD